MVGSPGQARRMRGSAFALVPRYLLGRAPTAGQEPTQVAEGGMWVVWIY